MLKNDFDLFWSVYPRHIGKGQARRAWFAAVKLAEPDVIIEAAKLFAQAMESKEMRYIPYPSTWLNGERWEDDLSHLEGATNTQNIAQILDFNDFKRLGNDS